MEMSEMVASKEEFDQVVDEVIRQDKYLQQINDTANSFLQRIQDWLEELLSGRISDVNQVASLSDTLSKVIMVVICIVIILGIALMIKYVYQCVRRRKELDEILGEKITKGTTPLSLLEKAKHYETEGAYRLSIRYGYIGLLLLMHEKGLLYIENCMTNTEIYESLKKSRYRSLEDFKRLMEAFNYTWYGQNDYTKEGFEAYKVHETLIWNEVTGNEKGQR